MQLQPNKHSSLDDWIDWLLNLHAQEVDLGLERVKSVAQQMELLEPAPLILTVAGTNGKGSSVAMLVSILSEAGFQVGSYTSPHIQHFNERIQINQQLVTDFAIVHAFDAIEKARGSTKLTYFEFSTLAALSIFKQSNLDVVVLEVGLGGRLDAVNIVDAHAALITAIDIDHVDWLGDDREKIAIEKAGVMRANRFAVCSDSNPPQSLEKYATDNHVELFQLGQAFSYRNQSQSQAGMIKGVPNWSWQNLSMDLIEFHDSGKEPIELAYPNLKGEFQLQNASGVVALILALWSKKQLPKKQLPFEIAPAGIVQAINYGLHKARHPGRLQEKWVNNQYWLIDVAHNPQSAGVLVDFLEQNDQRFFTAIFSVLKDKDSLPMVKALKPFVNRWLIADLDNPRSMSLQELTGLLQSAGVEDVDGTVDKCESIEVCTQKAIEIPTKVLVFGSFFTVAKVFDALDAYAKSLPAGNLSTTKNSYDVSNADSMTRDTGKGQS